MASAILFSVAIAMLLAVTVLVVGGLRWLLRGWRSVWVKGFLVHIVNIVAILLLMPLFPVQAFSIFTNGTLLHFLLLLTVADLARASLAQRTDRIPRHAPMAAFIALLVGAIGTSWLETYRQNAAFMYWQLGAHALYGYSPEREYLPVLRQAFPTEAQRILDAYDAQLHAGGQEGKTVFPRFPLEQVTQLLKEKRPFLAKAPDAYLVVLARKTQAYMARQAKFPAACAVFARGQVGTDPYFGELASMEDREAAGDLLAASLAATGAGMNHPQTRNFDAVQLAALEADFRSSLPLGPGTVATMSDDQACQVTLLYAEWLASLSDPQVAEYLAFKAQSQLSR
jgi:hypothetical protein